MCFCSLFRRCWARAGSGLRRRMPPKGQQIPPPDQQAPRPGDRVLRFRQHWLDIVLAGTKTAEARRGRTAPGGAWLGCGGRYASLGEPVHMATLADLQTHRQEHCVDAVGLPYGAYTYLWPLREVRALPAPVQFRNMPGPVTWISFADPLARDAAAASEASLPPRDVAGPEHLHEPKGEPCSPASGVPL